MKVISGAREAQLIMGATLHGPLRHDLVIDGQKATLATEWTVTDIRVRRTTLSFKMLQCLKATIHTKPRNVELKCSPEKKISCDIFSEI